MPAGKVRIESGAEQPNLNDQKNDNEGHGAGNCIEASCSRRQLCGIVRHAYVSSRTPTATSSSPRLSRMIRGSGRVGGPASTRPSSTEKKPLWQGHSSLLL